MVSEQPRVKHWDDPTLWTLFWKQVCSSCLYWQTSRLQLLVCRDGKKNVENFIGKLLIKIANCHCKKGQVLKSYEQRRKKKWEVMTDAHSVWVHSSTSCFNQNEILINGFSHIHGITGHLTFFSPCRLVPRVQGCGCFSTHTLGHSRQ